MVALVYNVYKLATSALMTILDRSVIDIVSKDWRDAVNKIHYRSILRASKLLSNPEMTYFSDEALQLLTYGFCQIKPCNNLASTLKNIKHSNNYNPLDLFQSEHLELNMLKDVPTIAQLINILEANNIFAIAKAYFGSDDIILSDFYLMAVARYNKRKHQLDGAAFWHRDSMGRSLKVFIPLNHEGNGIDTYLEAYSNVLSPIPQQWEMIRADKQIPLKEKIQLTNSISENIRDHLHIIKSMDKRILIFDTNTFHRGAYMEKEGNSDDKRFHLQCTISYKPTLNLYSMLQGHGINVLKNKITLWPKAISYSAAHILSTNQFFVEQSI